MVFIQSSVQFSTAQVSFRIGLSIILKIISAILWRFTAFNPMAYWKRLVPMSQTKSRASRKQLPDWKHAIKTRIQMRTQMNWSINKRPFAMNLRCQCLSMWSQTMNCFCVSLQILIHKWFWNGIGSLSGTGSFQNGDYGEDKFNSFDARKWPNQQTNTMGPSLGESSSFVSGSNLPSVSVDISYPNSSGPMEYADKCRRRRHSCTSQTENTVSYIPLTFPMPFDCGPNQQLLSTAQHHKSLPDVSPMNAEPILSWLSHCAQPNQVQYLTEVVGVSENDNLECFPCPDGDQSQPTIFSLPNEHCELSWPVAQDQSSLVTTITTESSNKNNETDTLEN